MSYTSYIHKIKLLPKIFKDYVGRGQGVSLKNIAFGMSGEEYSKFASLVSGCNKLYVTVSMRILLLYSNSVTWSV